MNYINDKTVTEKIGPEIEKYIIALLLKNQAKQCDNCHKPLIGYQIHHKRYGLDIGLKDLCLLCGDCHAIESNVKSVKGILRQVMA
jgi:RNase P subunit RPR2